MVGRSYLDFYDQDEDLEAMKTQYLARFEPGAPVAPMTHRRKLWDGREIYIDVSYAKVRQPNGDSLYLTIFRDITDRKREEVVRTELERKMLDAQRLESLGVLAGGIAHDFNNLLTGILGNVNLALMKLPDGARSMVQEELRESEKICLQAADLCKQMLAYTGRGPFQVQAVCLNHMLDEMRHLLQITVRRQVEIKYHLQDDLSSVEADVSQLRQVIMNLVINASEAMGEKGGVINVNTGTMEVDNNYLRQAQITVDAKPGRYVFLEVTDDGIGISTENLAHIFDPFFTTKFTGRGLGLAAVMGIVKGHHGVMRVDSKPGAGTTFRFLLPRVEGAPERVAPAAPAVVPWRGSGVILIVDDEDVIRKVTARVLEGIGFQVVQARNGLEGVEQFSRHAAELKAVLLDMTMPAMNGEEAFREMRKVREDIPVFLMSGYTEQSATERFKGKGLAGFFQKPFRVQELLNKLRAVLEAS